MKKRSGYLYKRSPTGNWYLRYMVEGKPIVQALGTKSRREAEKMRREIMHPLAVANKLTTLRLVESEIKATVKEIDSMHLDAIPVKGAFRLFFETPNDIDPGEATKKRYRSIWDRFEKWAGEQKLVHLEEVTKKHVKEYVSGLKAERFAPSTYNQHKRFLALLWSVVLPNKTNHWKVEKSRKLHSKSTRRKSLTAAQFEAVLDAAGRNPEKELKDIIVLIAFTGLRLVDAVLLKWVNVDFPEMVITVTPKKTERVTGKSVDIPFFPATAQILNARQEGKVIDPGGFVFPNLAAQYEKERDYVSRMIVSIFEQAGLEVSAAREGRGRKIPQYGAHSLRHYFVTQANAAGVPNAMVRSITGHESDDMLELYQHIDRELASELSARICGTGPQALALLPSQAPGGADAAQSDRGALMAALDALDAGNLAAARDLMQNILRKLDK